jgi:hypothetical protein
MVPCHRRDQFRDGDPPLHCERFKSPLQVSCGWKLLNPVQPAGELPNPPLVSQSVTSKRVISTFDSYSEEWRGATEVDHQLITAPGVTDKSAQLSCSLHCCIPGFRFTTIKCPPKLKPQHRCIGILALYDEQIS